MEKKELLEILTSKKIFSGDVYKSEVADVINAFFKSKFKSVKKVLVAFMDDELHMLAIVIDIGSIHYKSDKDAIWGLLDNRIEFYFEYNLNL